MSHPETALRTAGSLAVAAIAQAEAGNPDGAKPAWAAWAGTIVALISFIGWVLGSWIGAGIGGPIWVAGSLAMCIWLVWFGVTLARGKTG